MAKTFGRRAYLTSSAVVGIGALAGCLGDDDDAEYPNEAITKIIPYDPGGGTDIYLRGVGEHFPEHLGVDAQYENIPGASGMRGVSQAYNADPDGYTIVGVNPPSEVLPALLEPDQVDIDITQFEPVASVGYSSYVLIGTAGHEISDFEDMKDRYQDGEFENIGSTQAGGAGHISALLLRDQMGVEWDEFIAYDGAAPTVEAVASGEIPVGLPTSGSAEAAVEEGLVEPIALLRADGDNIFPDSPSVTDLGYDNIDYVGSVTRAILAPPETPQDRLDVLEEGIEDIINSDEMEEWSEETGQAIEFLDQEGTRDVWHGGAEQIPEQIDIDAVRDEL